jgi:hypothetical protein
MAEKSRPEVPYHIGMILLIEFFKKILSDLNLGGILLEY